MPAEQASADVRRKAAREVIDILHEIATLLVGVYQHITNSNNNKRRKNTPLTNNTRTPTSTANNSPTASP
jgi:hypothetical protein